MAVMKHAGKEILPGKPLLTGVINLSPESFYSGSVAITASSIEQKISEFAFFEVDCLDVGAMSTRPLDIYGGIHASSIEEKSRLEKYLPDLMDIASSYNLPVALDTQYSVSAEFGLHAGVDVINDISGFKTDNQLLDILADHSCDIVIMATEKKPGDVCGINATMTALQDSINLAVSADIARERIAIDPGFGGWQGRSKDCDLDLLSNFSQFSSFNLPIYVGISRKSTINTLRGGEEVKDRLPGSLILTQWLVKKGVNIIRTHDVKETRLALNVHNSLTDLS